jgi:hypothetical protein
VLHPVAQVVQETIHQGHVVPAARAANVRLRLCVSGGATLNMPTCRRTCRRRSVGMLTYMPTTPLFIGGGVVGMFMFLHLSRVFYRRHVPPGLGLAGGPRARRTATWLPVALWHPQGRQDAPRAA